MRDAFSAEDLHEGQPKNLQVEAEGSLMKILHIIGHLLWDRQLIASIDLGPACQPRSQHLDSLRRAESDQIILIEERRSRPDLQVSLQIQ